MNLFEELDAEIARQAESQADETARKLDSRIASLLHETMSPSSEGWKLLDPLIKKLTTAARPLLLEEGKRRLQGRALENLLKKEG